MVGDAVCHLICVPLLQQVMLGEIALKACYECSDTSLLGVCHKRIDAKSFQTILIDDVASAVKDVMNFFYVRVVTLAGNLLQVQRRNAKLFYRIRQFVIQWKREHFPRVSLQPF